MSAADDFQYHAADLDLLGNPDDERWSIRCLDVHKRLGGVPVLNGLNVAFPEDTITVVLGPSGTGKSVLIKHLIGLMFPDSGHIIVKGLSVPSLTMPDLLALRRKIGVLFQDGALFGSMSVFDNVAFPLRQHTDLSEIEISERVSQRLADVGLQAAIDDSPSQLSGGMRKRAGFARALVMEPDVVIFDEPDSGLDPVRTALLCELIQEMHGIYRGTYIVVTHDIASARRIGEYIALLWRGRIVEAGDAQRMFSSDNEFVRQFLSGSAEGPVDDGLTRGRSYANICSYGRVRAPPPFRAPGGGRGRLSGGPRDAPRASPGGGPAHGCGRRRDRDGRGGGGLPGGRSQRGAQGDGARGGAGPLPAAGAAPRRPGEGGRAVGRGPAGAGGDRGGGGAGGPGARLLRGGWAEGAPRLARRHARRRPRGGRPPRQDRCGPDPLRRAGVRAGGPLAAAAGARGGARPALAGHQDGRSARLPRADRGAGGAAGPAGGEDAGGAHPARAGGAERPLRRGRGPRPRAGPWA